MQLVGYRPAVDGPAALQRADEGAVTRLDLAPGMDLAYTLGERHCAGAVEGEHHRPCDAEASPYCSRHTSTWACARCTGDCELPLESCREEHAVYLAAFAPDTFKVGVTRSWRLETRLREQGADRAAHIRTVENGRRARRIEAGIAERLPDRVRADTKLDALHREVDAAAWERLLAEFDPLERFDFDYALDLDARPVAATVATGTVVGAQGRLLVLERGETRYAVDLRDLVGHEVVPGESDRGRQASLGSF